MRLATTWVNGVTTYRFCAANPAGAFRALAVANATKPAGVVRVRISATADEQEMLYAWQRQQMVGKESRGGERPA